jgi:hypothetical protein
MDGLGDDVKSALMSLMDLNISLVNLLAGYQALLRDLNVSDQVADEMLSDYHRALLAMIFTKGK